MPSGRVADEGRRDKIVEMYERGLTRIRIAEDLGVSITSVTNALIARGVTLRPVYAKKLTPEDELAIVARYQAGERRPALAAAYSVWPYQIREVLDRHGAALRDDRGRHRDFTEDEVEIIRRMAADGASQNAIAVAVRSSVETVRELMEQRGIPSGWTGPMAMERHYRWAGGRIQMRDGYVQLRVEQSDPLSVMADSKGYALEHRIVMARSLGRPLANYETVHHINGDRSDNRIENLQLRNGRHGKGAAFRCLDCGSTNIEATRLSSIPEKSSATTGGAEA
jgi:hypothetical protein